MSLRIIIALFQYLLICMKARQQDKLDIMVNGFTTVGTFTIVHCFCCFEPGQNAPAPSSHFLAFGKFSGQVPLV